MAQPHWMRSDCRFEILLIKRTYGDPAGEPDRHVKELMAELPFAALVLAVPVRIARLVELPLEPPAFRTVVVLPIVVANVKLEVQPLMTISRFGVARHHRRCCDCCDTQTHDRVLQHRFVP